MTQLEQFKKDLAMLEARRDVDKCLDYIKYLMTKVIESNQLGRAVDDILPEYVKKEELAKLYGRAVRKAMTEGDRYSQDEFLFVRSFTYSDEKE